MRFDLANTTIECVAGGGLYLKDGSVRAVLRNVHRSRGTITDRHITVRGCFLNGNRDQQIGGPGAPYESGGTHHREPDKTYIAGLQFFGIRYLTIEDTVLWNIKTFGVWIANGKYIHLSNIVVDNGSPEQEVPDAERRRLTRQYIHTDGVHFGGPIQYLIIDGLKLRTGDDALAFVANYAGVTDPGPYVGQGPIKDVTVINMLLADAYLGIRMLSTTHRIDRIVIDKVVGTVRWRMALMGHFVVPTHTGNFGSVTFSNVNVDLLRMPPAPDKTEESSKDTVDTDAAKSYLDELKDVDWGSESEPSLFSLNSPIESLNLRNVMARVVDARPLIRVGADAAIVRT